MRNLRRKMALCSEVAMIGGGGGKSSSCTGKSSHHHHHHNGKSNLLVEKGLKKSSKKEEKKKKEKSSPVKGAKNSSATGDALTGTGTTQSTGLQGVEKSSLSSTTGSQAKSDSHVADEV